MAPTSAQSIVLATEFVVAEPHRVWTTLERHRDNLLELGAHHVRVHGSTTEPGRVLTTVSVRTREPLLNLVQSRHLVRWFDAVGLQDLPAVFAGEKIARYDLAEGEAAVTPFVVAAVIPVPELAVFLDQVREGEALFRRAGIRKLSLFGAFDDPCEVMLLLEMTDQRSAQRWLSRSDAAAAWLSAAGVGVYPPVFLGITEHSMHLPEAHDSGDR